MLITFRVANFLSFNEEEEFSMLAGKVRKPVRPAVPIGTGVEVLKMAVLYGANASGKSNLVKSIDFAQNVIVSGLRHTIPFNSHFRLKKDNREKSSKFEFEFEQNGKVYAYGFVLDLNNKILIEEWLFEIKKTTQKAIFERVVEKTGISKMVSKPPFKGEDETRFTIYAEDIQNNEFLLSVLGQKMWSEDSSFYFFKLIFTFFKFGIQVFYPTSHHFPHSFLDFTDNETKQFFSKVLSFFNTGVIDVELQKENGDQILNELPLDVKNGILTSLEEGFSPSILIDNKRYLFSNENNNTVIASRVLTRHEGDGENEDFGSNFDFENESDGTKRLFDFVPLLQILSKFKVTVIVDEIDRSLHPELIHKLLEYYRSSTLKTNSQLIVTTHESSLLDLSLLRRDEIWFVEKNKQGESHLYSLEEFQPRFDKEIRKAYLQGRYGAIPFISDVQQLNWEISNAEG